MPNILSSFAQGLTLAKQYDLLAAIRGGDQQAEYAIVREMKALVTCRLRVIAFRSYKKISGDWDNKRLTATEADQFVRQCQAIPRSEWDAISHYRSHLRDGIRATIKHPIWGGHGETLYDVLWTSDRG